MSAFDGIFTTFGLDALETVHGEEATYYDNANPGGIPLTSPVIHRQKIQVSEIGNTSHSRTIVEIRKSDVGDIDDATGRVKLANGDILGDDPGTEYTIAEIEDSHAGTWRVLLA